jgi:regulator of protease activity HflC (stomatin/prohibitin superfamily)
MSSEKVAKRAIFTTSIVILLIILMIWAVVRIPPGTVGVYYSAFSGVDMENVRLPGWHFQIPILQQVYKVKTARDTISMYGADVYSCLDDRNCDDVALNVPSKEGLLVTLDLSVLYKVRADQSPRIIQELTADYRQKTLVPRIRSAARTVTGTFQITQLYGEGRDQLQLAIFDRLEAVLAEDGFELEEVLVRDVDLPEQIRLAIEDKQTAEQRSFQKQFEIDLAEKEAERIKIQGEGIAAGKIAIAEGDAEALRVVAASIGANPQILKFKNLEVLQDLYNNPNTKFVALPSDNLILPTDLQID